MGLRAKPFQGGIDAYEEAPHVSISMDLTCWNFVLQHIEGPDNDLCISVIRDSCKKAIEEWLPSVYKKDVK